MTKSEAVQRQSFLRRVRGDKIETLLAQFVDIKGVPKVKAVPAPAIEAFLDDGAGFAGGAVVGLGQGAHDSDLVARPDLSSYSPMPWQPGVGRVACDLFVEGKSWPFCSRTVLRRVLAAARAKGYTFKLGVEPEFFLLAKNSDGSLRPGDPEDRLAKPCYDYRPLSNALPLLTEAAAHMNALGWGVYQIDHEDANGQYEINFGYDDALITADRVTLLKMMLSQIARRHGLIATFMPKPFKDRTGSGQHFHFSLWDASGKKNLFADPSNTKTGGISKAALHFAGGILKHASALTAVSSPTVNCYKRLLISGSASGYTWVPAYPTLGANNRTHMLRTPAPGRMECRVISSAANVYLTAAALIAAGLDGLERRTDPGLPSRENMYALDAAARDKRGLKPLPQNLPEALAALEANPVVSQALGQPLTDEFLKVKRQEWFDYHSTVSPWEIDRYLPDF
ncbi:MAG TPA: type III glutamate--ammonia ligase [Planctomycetota bacterium]